MRYLHISPFLLICSLVACMKPGDVHKIAEMKEDHTESRLVQDRDLGSTTPHPTPDNQSQRLELDNKINQMDTESSVSSSSVNVPGREACMKDIGMGPIIRKGANEVVFKLDKNLSAKFQDWTHLFVSPFEPLEIGEWSLHVMGFFCDKRKTLFRIWYHKFYNVENPQYRGPRIHSSEDLSKIMEEAKGQLLQHVFEIEQVKGYLPKDLEVKMTRNILEKGYEMIFNHLIGLQKLDFYSEAEMSSFLNKKENIRLISGYANNKYPHFETNTGTDSWNLNIKQSLETSESVEGFSEFLKLLNQETWKTIEFDYLRDPLISLLEEKSLNIHYYYQIVNIFLNEALSNKMEVSVDLICFMLDQISYFCKTLNVQPLSKKNWWSVLHSRLPSTIKKLGKPTAVQPNIPEEIQKYMQGCHMSNIMSDQQAMSPTKLNGGLSGLISVQTNDGLVFLLKLIQKKLDITVKKQNTETV